MQRSKSHVVVGLCFVLAAIVVAGGIYAGLVMRRPATPAVQPTMAASMPPIGQGGSDALATEPQPLPSTDNSSSLPEPMVGDFAEGKGSDYACEGRQWTFNEDGSFDLAGDDSNRMTQGDWIVVNSVLFLTNMTQTSDQENDTVRVPDMSYKVSKHGGILTIGKHRYLPCAPNG